MSFLQSNFSNKSNPSYFVKEIEPVTLEEQRSSNKLKEYNTNDGSSSFQVIVFGPMERCAAPQICLCDNCKDYYGSCSLFKTYSMYVKILKGNILQSDIQVDSNESESSDNDLTEVEVVHEFHLPGSVRAIAASDKLWTLYGS